MNRSRCCRQDRQSSLLLDGNTLCYSVVVIATHSRRRMTANPFQTRNRIGCVVDQIAQKQTDVKGFVDRGQRGPISVDVRQQQNSHDGFFARRTTFSEVNLTASQGSLLE